MTVTRRKKHGVVYTPPHIVDDILDNVLPENRDALKSVSLCDPSCGDGAFLARFSQRVLADLEKPDALSVLQRMAGYDIDEDAISQCRFFLDQLVHENYPGECVDWNIKRRNAFDREAFVSDQGRFTHVVGNPPYVRVQHLEQEGRNRLAGQWTVIRGATDLYLIFYELGLDLLKSGGMLGYITPSSWLKSQSGELLRSLLVTSHSVKKLIDFAQYQVFDDVTTYTVITIVQKNGSFHTPTVSKFNGNGFVDSGTVAVDRDQPHLPWIASTQHQRRRLENLRLRGPKLCEVADIHVGIQTLADDVFIHTAAKQKKRNSHRGRYVPCLIDDREVELEKWILRDVVKASVMKAGKDQVSRVLIYPYTRKGKLLPEQTIASKAPRTYEWLQENKQRLLNRDKGKFDPHRWYSFGRHVSITSGFGEKILTSGMNILPNFQLWQQPDTTFYSGYCIKSKGQINLGDLLPVLNSEDMDFFIKHSSRPYQGGWMSYAKSFIKDFPIPAHILSTA